MGTTVDPIINAGVIVNGQTIAPGETNTTPPPLQKEEKPFHIKDTPMTEDNKGGRPCEFCKNKENILKLTNEFIDKCANPTKPQIPYKEELAVYILKVHMETIGSWVSKKVEDTTELEHPEFSDAIKRLETLQKLMLLKRTIGRYNPTGAIFQLKVNHGAIETEKQILAGSKDEPMKMEIEIIEDKPTE